MPTINGVAINFAGGVKGTTFTITGVGTLILQDMDHAKEADKEDILDEDSELAARTWFNRREKATFNYIVKGSDLAGAKTQSTIPALGAIGTVANTTTYAAVAGTNWEVIGVSTKGSNTTALRVSLQLEKNAGITAAAAAGS